MNFALKFSLLVLLLISVASPLDKRSFNRERTYDVQHYVIRLQFDHKKRSVAGDSTITLKPLSGTLAAVELDAAGIDFESVTLDGRETALAYTRSGSKLLVRLDREYAKGETVSIRFRYKAKPKKGIYFVDALKEKGKEIRSAQIWTQGESEETHHWLPSFDFPDDKATTEQFLTVKEDETAIANGELVSNKPNGDGTRTFHYRMEKPHSLYLTSFVIGKYVRVEDRYGDVPLGYYVYPGTESIVPLAYGKTKDMMRVFEKLTGIEYPYNKYDQTIVADFSFGGMENITATTMADTEIFFARTRLGKGLVEDLVSHELAHSWFGNLVTCRNWAELWLNEGFATYLEAVFLEEQHGKAAYEAKIGSDAGEYLAYASSPNSNVHGLFNTKADAADDDSMFDTITYQKGSAVLHTLRREIGTEAFWKGARLYLDRHSYGTVETTDLLAAMEEASGRDLDWFFRQWVYGLGHPELRVTESTDKGSGVLTVKIEQTQPASDGVEGLFRLPLDIAVKVGDSEMRRSVVMEGRSLTLEFDVGSKPAEVVVDPDFKLPVKTVKKS